MDKRYYYRLLGLREDATPQQIKDAYTQKVRKLKSDDYADDPEYVERKLAEVRHAYGVLTGSAAPVTRAQKEAGFERWKDAMDGGEDAIKEAKKALRKGSASLSSLGSSLGGALGGGKQRQRDDEGGSRKQAAGAQGGMRLNGRSQSGTGKQSGQPKTYYAPHEAGSRRQTDRKKKNVLVIVVAAVIFLNVFMSLIVSGCNAVFDAFDNDVSFSYNTPEGSVDEDTKERVEALYEVAGLYDFDGFLDASERDDYADQVEWEISDDTYQQIWGNMTDLAYDLGLYSNSEAIEYITGDEDFYWENDDLTNGLMMASVMEPPEFEDVAGCTNLYTDEVILDYSGYFRFLQNVAEDQTNELIGW